MKNFEYFFPEHIFNTYKFKEDQFSSVSNNLFNMVASKESQKAVKSVAPTDKSKKLYLNENDIFEQMIYLSEFQLKIQAWPITANSSETFVAWKTS